jgi:hypothetical protein
MFFARKYIKTMFFHFLKINFDISISKRSENIKKYLILSKKNPKFSWNAVWNAVSSKWRLNGDCSLVVVLLYDLQYNHLWIMNPFHFYILSSASFLLVKTSVILIFILLIGHSTSQSWMVSDHNLQPLELRQMRVLPQLSQCSFNV